MRFLKQLFCLHANSFFQSKTAIFDGKAVGSLVCFKCDKTLKENVFLKLK